MIYNRAALAAARQGRMPSDGMDDVLNDALSNLEHDNYERSHQGYENRQADIELIRAALSSYSSAQPTASAEPVYAFRRNGQDAFVTCGPERFAELQAKPQLFETRIFYAAPVAQEPVALETIARAIESTDLHAGDSLKNSDPRVTCAEVVRSFASGGAQAQPSGDWVTVPAYPTKAMIESAEEAYMPFGDMEIALRRAILSAPTRNSGQSPRPKGRGFPRNQMNEHQNKEWAMEGCQPSAQDREDAERYRWLRDGGNEDIGVVRGFDCIDCGSTTVAATYEEGLEGEQLDDAIDAARAAKEKS